MLGSILRLVVKPLYLLFLLWFLIDTLLGDWIDLILFIELVLFSCLGLLLLVPALAGALLMQIRPSEKNDPLRLGIAASFVLLFSVLTVCYYATMPWEYAQHRMWRREAAVALGPGARQFVEDMEKISSVFQDSVGDVEERPNPVVHHNVYITAMLESWFVRRLCPMPDGEWAYDSPQWAFGFLQTIGTVVGYLAYLLRLLLWFLWSQLLILYPCLSPFPVAVAVCANVLFRDLVNAGLRLWAVGGIVAAILALSALLSSGADNADGPESSPKVAEQARSMVGDKPADAAGSTESDDAERGKSKELRDPEKGMIFKIGSECKVAVAGLSPGDQFPVYSQPTAALTANLAGAGPAVGSVKQGEIVRTTDLTSLPVGLLGVKQLGCVKVVAARSDGNSCEGWLLASHLMPPNYFITFDFFTNWWLRELGEGMVTLLIGIGLWWALLRIQSLVAIAMGGSDRRHDRPRRGCVSD